MLSLRLVGPRVLVERLSTPEQTRSGLWLPSIAKELPNMGHVAALGRYPDGRPLDLRLGQLVIFPKYHDRYVFLDQQYLIFHVRELLAAIDD